MCIVCIARIMCIVHVPCIICIACIIYIYIYICVCVCVCCVLCVVCCVLCVCVCIVCVVCVVCVCVWCVVCIVCVVCKHIDRSVCAPVQDSGKSLPVPCRSLPLSTSSAIERLKQTPQAYLKYHSRQGFTRRILSLLGELSCNMLHHMEYSPLNHIYL